MEGSLCWRVRIPPPTQLVEAESRWKSKSLGFSCLTPTLRTNKINTQRASIAPFL